MLGFGFLGVEQRARGFFRPILLRLFKEVRIHGVPFVTLTLNCRLQILRRSAGLYFIKFEVLDFPTQSEDRLFVILFVDGFGSRGCPEKTGCLNVTLGVRFFGERLVTMGRVGFALEGGIDVVERLRRDFSLGRNDRRDERGANQAENVVS